MSESDKAAIRERLAGYRVSLGILLVCKDRGVVVDVLRRYTEDVAALLAELEGKETL